jgi:hypothetical protein
VVLIELLQLCIQKLVMFLDTIKGLLMYLKSQKTGFSVKGQKRGLLLEVAYATIKLVPRISIAPQPMYP